MEEKPHLICITKPGLSKNTVVFFIMVEQDMLFCNMRASVVTWQQVIPISKERLNFIKRFCDDLKLCYLFTFYLPILVFD